MARRTKDKQVAGAAEYTGGAVYVENLVWSLLPPWLTAVALFLAGGLAHMAWGHPDRVGLISAFLGVSVSALVGLSVWVSRPRHPVVRVLSAATVAVCGLWIILATNLGWGHGMWWLYPLVSMVLCSAWNIKRLLRGAGGDNGLVAADSTWGDVRDRVSLLRATIKRQDQVGARMVVQAQLEPGTTQAQAKQDGEVLAGLMQVPPNHVTVSGDPDDASKVEVSVIPIDMLTKTFAWPGPSYPGTSIADHPIRLGTQPTGDPVELRLVGERGGKVVSHVMLQGMSGAGKSELLQEISDEVLSRTDTELEYIDTGDKAEQTVGPLRPGLSRPPSITDADARKHLSDLNREIKPRADHLAERGLREWTKGCGLSFKVVIIDEAGDSIAADKKGFTRLARKGRSVGILLVVAQQNFSQRTMPVDARKNFGTGICLGIAEAGDADWVLSEGTIEAGAKPWLWKNFKPGYFYIEDGGIPQPLWPIANRACLTDPEKVLKSVQANAVHRWKGMPLELAPAGEAVDDDFDDFDDFDSSPPIKEDLMADRREVQQAAYAAPAELAREMARIDPNAPMPTEGMDMDRELGAPAGEKLTTVQSVAALDVVMAELREKGLRGFRRADLVRAGAMQRCDRSKAWLSAELRRRVDRGELAHVGEPDEGMYAWADLLAHAE
jgi:hypothetical protein